MTDDSAPGVDSQPTPADPGQTPLPPPPPPPTAPAAAAPPPPPPAAPPGPPAPGAPAAYQQPLPPQPPEKKGHGGLWFGVILILVGVAVLLGQFVPGVAWWMLWPLIIVIAGIVQAVTPGKDGWSVNRFFDGLVSVTIGLVLLGNTTGVISWAVWWRLIWLWPVLLVAAGLGIIGRATSQRWLGVFGSIAVILALIFAASLAYTGVGVPGISSGASAGSIDYSAPVDGVTSAKLDMNVGAAEVSVDSSDGDLVQVSGTSPWGEPTASTVRSGSTATVKVNMAEGSTVFVPNANNARLAVALSPDVDWDVTMKSGAVATKADFSDVRVDSLYIETGASATEVRLGDPSASQGGAAHSVNVKSGVAAVTILVPEDAHARIRFATGLSANQTPSGYTKNGEYWESPDFDTAGPYWDIRVESGLGSTTVKTY